MKKGAVRITSIPFLIIAGFIALAIVSGKLYHQNKMYQQKNRRLIILNDSILSVNIELQNALKQKDSALSAPLHKTVREKMSVYKINNILVPVDLSESSLNALDVAVNIAQKK